MNDKDTNILCNIMFLHRIGVINHKMFIYFRRWFCSNHHLQYYNYELKNTLLCFLLLQVKNTTSKGPPPSHPPITFNVEDKRRHRTHSSPYCSTILEFSTHTLNIELEELPVLDILSPTPVCWQADCRFEIGPLCFSQDLQHLSGG